MKKVFSAVWDITEEQLDALSVGESIVVEGVHVKRISENSMDGMAFEVRMEYGTSVRFIDYVGNYFGLRCLFSTIADVLTISSEYRL